ncbi:MAG: NAD(+)/NADH kinase [Bacilli bacterium]|nr:NAD(+)/NADH kinase [Bacilli bacterium]
MKIKLFPNKNADSLFIADILKEKLENNGFSLVENDYELAIAIGGDGSFLHMVNANDFNENIKYIGINNGTLGFLQEIKPTEISSFIEYLKEENYKEELISYENIKVVTNDEAYYFKGLNETVIRDMNLSTAYNLSCNGAIIFNGIHTLQVTPIAPINNNIYRTISNPIVLPEDRIIKLIPNKRTTDIMLLVDGVNHVLKNVQYIEIRVSEVKLKCIRMNDYDYTNIINDKFLN